MKLLVKMFFISIMNVMMLFSLTLAPIPFIDKVSVVYAADDDEDPCKEEEIAREDGAEPRVYRPGCDLDDALTAAKDEAPSDGIVGTVEQFIAAAFGLAAINSMVFTQHPMATVDCPDYINPQVTLRVMQAGSLAYITGNIQSNSKFKRAAKEAVDITLTPQAKKNEEVEDEEQAEENKQSNSDQIDAYIALMKIYEAKVEALNNKSDMAMVAELAYLGALATEAIMTTTHAGKCTAGTGLDEGTEATITTTITSAVAGAATGAAAVATSALCADAAVSAPAKQVINVESEIETKAAAATQATTQATESSTDAGFISKLFQTFASVFTLGLSALFMNKAPYTAEVKEAEMQAEAAAMTGLFASILTRQESGTATLSASCAKCPTCAAQAAAIQGLETTKLKPYICCGSRVTEIPNGFSIVVPGPGKINIETDVIMPPIIVDGKNEKSLEYIKSIVNNFLHSYGTSIIEAKQIGAVEKAKLYKGLIRQLDYFDHNFFQILESPEFNAELASLKHKYNQNEGFNIIEKIKNDVTHSLISEAHASGFGELMGLGVKMLALQYFMGDFMRNTALTSPNNRMITYGVMAAVNTALMIFNKGASDEAQKRLDIVTEEARVFAASRPELTQRLNTLGNGKLNLTKADLTAGDLAGQQIVGCADPKGGSFVPAMCPSQLRRGNLNIPINPETKRRFGNSPLGQALPLLSDLSYQSASGQGLMDPKTMGGTLGDLRNVRNALRKQADNAVAVYDKEVLAKQKRNIGLKLEPVGKSNARFRKMFTGDRSKNGITKDQMANLEGSLGSIKVPEVKKLSGDKKVAANKVKYTQPKFDMPDAGDFNFDMGGGSDSAMDTGSAGAGSAGGSDGLDSFQVNAGEINERKEESIFKIISNRYLRSYPVLLEEEN